MEKIIRYILVWILGIAIGILIGIKIQETNTDMIVDRYEKIMEAINRIEFDRSIK